MIAEQRSMTHSVASSTLADILERVLDKGVVIAGDIKIKLCDVELLSIQIRLLICSVEKARELGIPWWWQTSPAPPPVARPPQPLPAERPSALSAKRSEADPLSQIYVSRRGTQQEMALKSRKAPISVERLV